MVYNKICLFDNRLTVIPHGLTIKSQPQALWYSQNPGNQTGESYPNNEAFKRSSRNPFKPNS